MNFSREEVARINGDNRFFADVADTLREDFMDEGQKFYHQCVKAQWEESVNLFTRAPEIILRVEVEDDMPPEIGGVVLMPAACAGIDGIQAIVRKGDGYYSTFLFRDEVSDYRALETVRALCVARFGVENRNE